MEGKTCFFIGHRDASDSLLPILDAEVERHITEYGGKRQSKRRIKISTLARMR